MDRLAAQAWIDRYEQCWRTAGTTELRKLFATDASYRTSPWEPPVEGLEALAEFWDQEREGPDEQFTMTSEVLAADGDLAVARVEVEYANGITWRDLWLIRLDGAGRCTAFEEWPFSPDQPDGHG